MHMPEHVAIIMDGNGRWAQERSLPRFYGHRQGVASLKNAVRFCAEQGIKILTVYAFSTENWSRPPGEVRFLMELMKKTFRDEIDQLHQEGTCIKMIGNRKTMSKEFVELWNNAEEYTKDNRRLLLNIAFNYGGRDEIVLACQEIARLVQNGQLEVSQIDQTLFSDHLLTKGFPDPDLVIRTGGEFRQSNFLLWQSAYSEWYITSKLWPDFAESDFSEALQAYAQRERRFGRVLETEKSR